MDLGSDTVVVITGAGNGIGAALSRAFADTRAQVVVADLDREAATCIAAGIVSAGGRATVEQVDVSDSQAMAAFADRVFGEFGRVDVLCCNAGVSMRPFRATWDASLEDYAWLNRVNYLGFVHSLLSFVPRMRDQRQGRRQVVVTSSITAVDVSPGHAPYAATKAAVTTLADALRIELAETTDEFGVTVLYPGYVPTAIKTSERLRPEKDRSSVRGVRVFVPQRPAPDYDLPVDAETVATLVVEAVSRDADVCMTHRFPADAEMRLAHLRDESP